MSRLAHPGSGSCKNWPIAGGSCRNTATGEWCAFAEGDLLDRFARNELYFILGDRGDGPTDSVAAKLTPDRSAYPPLELVVLARKREQYLKEIDRRQPIPMTKASMEPLIRLVAERIKDDKPPGWLTIWRNYRQWVAAGRDVRVITLRHADRGRCVSRLLPEVQIVCDRVIEELYMTAERRRVPGRVLGMSSLFFLFFCWSKDPRAASG